MTTPRNNSIDTKLTASTPESANSATHTPRASDSRAAFFARQREIMYAEAPSRAKQFFGAIKDFGLPSDHTKLGPSR